jgi:hypothetical protein
MPPSRPRSRRARMVGRAGRQGRPVWRLDSPTSPTVHALGPRSRRQGVWEGGVEEGNGGLVWSKAPKVGIRRTGNQRRPAHAVPNPNRTACCTRPQAQEQAAALREHNLGVFYSATLQVRMRIESGEGEEGGEGEGRGEGVEGGSEA